MSLEWEDEAYVLSARSHGETGAIVELLTEARGKVAAHVAGAASRRMKPFLQPGARVIARYRARVEGQLGSASLEPMGEGPSSLFDDRLALAAQKAGLPLTVLESPRKVPGDALKEDCDLIVDLHGSLRTRVLTFRQRAPVLRAASFRLLRARWVHASGHRPRRRSAGRASRWRIPCRPAIGSERSVRIRCSSGTSKPLPCPKAPRPWRAARLARSRPSRTGRTWRCSFTWRWTRKSWCAGRVTPAPGICTHRSTIARCKAVARCATTWRSACEPNRPWPTGSTAGGWARQRARAIFRDTK